MKLVKQNTDFLPFPCACFDLAITHTILQMTRALASTLLNSQQFFFKNTFYQKKIAWPNKILQPISKRKDKQIENKDNRENKVKSRKDKQIKK
jgi:hypothetical protein